MSRMLVFAPFAAALLLAACAGPAMTQAAAAPPRAEESVLPGTIGVVVRQARAGVVVAAVREGLAALREGDTIVRYNGVAVTSVRQFNRLVVESPPGSTASLELLRGGAVHRVEVPVRQLDTVPRG